MECQLPQGMGGQFYDFSTSVISLMGGFLNTFDATLFDEGIYKEKILPHIHYKYWMKNQYRSSPILSSISHFAICSLS